MKLGVVQIAIPLIAPIVWAGIGGGTAGAESQVKRALIVAPSYQELQSAEYLNAGAQALHRQLINAGFDAENVTLLPAQTSAASFPEALKQTIGRCKSEDLLLIAIGAYGVNLDGNDYVCFSDAQAANIQSGKLTTDSEQSGCVSVQKIVNELSASGVSNCLLLIDSPVGRSPFPAQHSTVETTAVADGFGRQVLAFDTGKESNNTWVITNRSGRLAAPDSDGNVMTRFMQAILNGLASDADTANPKTKGVVTLLELTDFLSAYAEAADYTQPTFQGKLNIDMELVPTTEKIEDRLSLPVADREILSQALANQALKSLFIEFNADAALTAIDRALAYSSSGDPNEVQELKGLRLTALAAKGDFQTAWNDAKNEDLPLLVVVPTESSLFESEVGTYTTQHYGWRNRLTRRVLSDPVSGRIAANTMVRVTQVAEKRITFDVAYHRFAGQSRIEHELLEDQTVGWLNVSGLSFSDRTSADASVVAELYQLSADDQ